MFSPDRNYFIETENESDRRQGLWKPPRSILGIQGSPRGRQGATELTYAVLVKGLEQGGARVETVHLADLNLQPCIGCFKCWTNLEEGCPIKDDLTPLIDRIPSFDLMIWAMPLYMEGMPGLMKNLVDRLMVLNHPAIVRKEGRCVHPCCYSRMPNMVLLAVCGFFGTENFSPLLNHVNALAVDQHTPLAACLLRPDTLSLMRPEGRISMEGVKDALIRAGEQIVDKGTVSEDTIRETSRPLLEPEHYFELAKSWWK